MTAKPKIVLALLLAGVPGTTSRLSGAPQSSNPSPQGVIVEEAAKNFQGERAGLAKGDILLHWSCDSNGGPIESPFDLSEVEAEQGPRCKVTLEGLRGSDKRAWVMGPDEWRVKTRPQLSESLLAIYREGQELAKAGKLPEAAGRWRDAAGQVDGSQPPWLRAWLLFHAAESLADGKQWKEADAAFGEAVQGAPANPAVRARLFLGWAYAFRLRDDWANAQKRYQDALTESRKSGGDTLAAAESLRGLGVVTWKGGDLVKGDEYLRQALAIAEKLAPGSLVTAGSLNNLGLLAWDRGDLPSAEQYHRQALAIREKLAPGSSAVSASLNNLGYVVEARGDLASAEEYLRQSLAIEEELDPNSLATAHALNNLGIVAADRGDLIRTEEYFRRAVAIKEKLSLGTREFSESLVNLGTVEMQLGNMAEAEKYLRQTLDIQERVAAKSLEFINTLATLGDIAQSRGDLAKAEDYYGHALAIAQDVAPGSHHVAMVLDQLGDTAQKRGDLDKAEEYFRRALEISRRVVPGSTLHAETLARLAGIMRRKQQLDSAAELYAQALDALESQTARLGGSESVRAGFRAEHAGYYSDYMAVLLSQKKPELAFQVLERSRARTLLEMLATANIDIRKGVDPKLLDQQQALQQAVSAKSDARIKLFGSKHTEEQVAALDKEIKGLLAQYEELEGEIRESSPGYAALTQPQPLGAKEIQGQLLDADTVLLEYALGSDRSYVWVVSSHSLAAYELPKRTEIESSARQVYGLLTAPNRVTKGETPSQRQARLAKAGEDYPKAAAQLSQMVLGPVAALLEGKRLLIVSDGALQYIPFAALPVPGESNAPPLIAEHEIVNLPSASVLAVLRQEEAARKPASKAVAVLADPVFNKNDPRVAISAKEQNQDPRATRGPEEMESDPTTADLLVRSVSDVDKEAGLDFYLSRLRFTRKEAEAILAVTPAGQGMNALDFKASRATATSPDLAQYRIVHFATHGLLDNEHPELSGLVLSLVDEQGQPQNGFLELQDIYNLNLPAELVVLSACETGLGKEINGEGLVGLTRGFMYAGASRVVASLWKVDDVATAELMGYFYEAMEKQGMRPAAALREAQTRMWKQQRWAPAYYWAAFQIQGEWR